MGTACACVCAKLLQSCSTLCDPMDCNPPAFFRQEYWSGLPCPPPGELPDPGIKPVSLVSPALAGGFFTTTATWEAQEQLKSCQLPFILFSFFLHKCFLFTFYPTFKARKTETIIW